ncbi:DUF166 domain-containing protein [Chloroflexota bacterium]
MRILAAVQGEYGKRIVANLQVNAPADWTMETLTLPPRLPMVIDEPEDFLPSRVPGSELLLALIESDGAAQLVPALAGMSGSKSVILPVDDSSWLPLGLQNQLEEELARAGVKAVFPKTFCTLTGDSSGFRGFESSYMDETISAFGNCFGRPELKIEKTDGKITSVTVKRGAPCGSTHSAAAKLVGMAVEEAVPAAGLIVHQFPCLASMQQDEIDTGVIEYLMAVSGYVMNEAVEKSLRSDG